MPVLTVLGRAGIGARLIHIDPPYNKRTSFHYYKDSERPADWAEIMRWHIRLARQCLTEDGAMTVHIDDSELTALRQVMDDIFGAGNFVATIIWEKRLGRENRSAFSADHEYVLVYAKDKKLWQKQRNKLEPTSEYLARYSNPDNDPRGPWISVDSTSSAGPGRRAEQFYDITLNSGRTVRPATGKCWTYTRVRYDEMIADGRIYLGKGDSVPRVKKVSIRNESRPSARNDLEGARGGYRRQR